MKLGRVALALAMGILVSGGSAAAQTRLASVDGAYPGVERVGPARARLAAGDLNGARRQLVMAAREARVSGAYAGAALWLLADLEWSDRPARAAATLDELAESAAAHGDLVLQAQALLEGAVLYQKLGDPARARARVDQLIPLLQSSYLPGDVRDAIRARMRR